MSSTAKKLAATDPTMAALVERVGKIDLKTRLKRRSEERPPDAYGALLRSIVGQQVSTKAARAIYLRVLDLFGGNTPSPAQLLAVSEEELRGAGLSGRKVEYIRDLVEMGYGDRILLSQDVSQRSHQAAQGGPGLTFVFEELAEAAVAAGVEPEILRMMNLDNPRRALFGA